MLHLAKLDMVSKLMESASDAELNGLAKLAMELKVALLVKLDPT